MKIIFLIYVKSIFITLILTSGHIGLSVSQANVKSGSQAIVYVRLWTHKKVFKKSSNVKAKQGKAWVTWGEYLVVLHRETGKLSYLEFIWSRVDDGTKIDQLELNITCLYAFSSFPSQTWQEKKMILSQEVVVTFTINMNKYFLGIYW